MVRKASTPKDKPKRKVKFIPKRPLRYTKEEVAKALTENGGFVYLTADKMDIHPQTMTNYIKRWPELRKTIKYAKRKALDEAESRLLECIRNNDIRAIKYFLSCKGKRRGYKTHKEISVNARQEQTLVTIDAPVELSEAKKRDILNKVRERNGLPPLPASTPLQIGLKELPNIVPDNNGTGKVVIEQQSTSVEKKVD